MMTRHWIADRERGPGQEALDAIVTLLASDEIVILPTDTLYGLHGRAESALAADKIAAIKGRADEKPYVVLSADVEGLASLGARLTSEVVSYLQTVWPAPLTAIVRIAKPLPASRGRDTLAVRVPALPWLRALLERTGPLISTSVNRAGREPAKTLHELDSEIAAGVSGIVDSGRFSGAASTIVDFTGSSPTIVRQGDFAFAQNLWKKARKSL